MGECRGRRRLAHASQVRVFWHEILALVLIVGYRSLFHGSDEDEFVGFDGNLNDFDMDVMEDEYVHS